MNKQFHNGSTGPKCVLLAALVAMALFLGGCGGNSDPNMSNVTGGVVPPGSTPLPPPAAPASDTKPNFKHP